MIYIMCACVGIEDEVRWMLTTSGVLYVKSMFKTLEPNLNKPFPTILFEKLVGDQRINVFT